MGLFSKKEDKTPSDNVIDFDHEGKPQKVNLVTRWLEKGSDIYVGIGFSIIRRFLISGIHGWFVYSQNSGPLYVGAATFFGLLSLIPVFSCGIFLLGIFNGSPIEAHTQFFAEIKLLMPPTSHLLVDEVSRLTSGHILSTPLNLVSVIVLIWTAKGFFGNLTRGLMMVTRVQNRGGSVMSTMRALGSVISFGLILVLCFELSPNGSLIRFMQSFFPNHFIIQELIMTLAKLQVFTILSTVLLVSLLFKWLIHSPIFNCIEGASTFIVGFYSIKSFHWVYLHYNKIETDFLYGAFSPMVIGVLWGYFMLTVFYIGACVASLPKQKELLSKIPEIPRSWEEK